MEAASVEPQPQPELRAALIRWERLRRRRMTRSLTDPSAAVVREAWRPWAAPLWPYSQVLHARILLDAAAGRDEAADLGTNQLLRGLTSFADGEAFAATRSLPHAAAAAWSAVAQRERPPRYYDDNAWIGLADEQRRGLASLAGRPDATTDDAHEGEQLLHWLLAAQEASGGMPWREGVSGLHACSTGSVGLLAARVHLRSDSPKQPRAELLEAARRAADFMHDVLGTPGLGSVGLGSTGLIADNVDPSGRLERTLWTYNQGLAIGLDVLLHAAGVDGALDRARRTTDATLDWADERTLWAQPPCFNAVLVRMLLLLHHHDPQPRVRAFVDDYTARVLSAPLDLGGTTGRGRYPGSGVIDEAGDIQVLALAALPSPLHASLC